MASSGEARGERGSSGHVFLAGHALLVLGYIFFTVGFATDRWLTTSNGTRFGLWEMCQGQVCQLVYPGELSAWMDATRAMQTMALMCYLGGVLASLFIHCVTHTFPHPDTCRPLRNKTRVLEVCTAVGCAFCLIGVSVYGGKGDDQGTLGYSYSLSVFSLFLSVTGTIMTAVTRNAVTNTDHSRVSPQQQTGGISNSDSHSSHRSQIHGGASYPYGQGQHYPVQPRSNEVRYGHNENPHAYGRGAPPLPPGNPAHLPYPMLPEEPAGNFGTMTLPEPGPISGEDREGLGPHRGPSHGPPGRLPPIREASPSAPPPPDDDQPPSYMEAIGQTH